jgi:hypothetical protein
MPYGHALSVALGHRIGPTFGTRQAWPVRYASTSLPVPQDPVLDTFYLLCKVGL